MEGRTVDNCSKCAYAEKSGKEMWCPFHDEPVSSKLVCDDFLDEFQAPLYASLAEDAKKAASRPGVVIKDILCYAVTVALTVLCIICTAGLLGSV